MSWFAGYTDPAIVLFWWTEAGAAGWANGYTLIDERIDALVAETRTLGDGPERNAALAEVCSLINEASTRARARQQAGLRCVPFRPD